MLVHFTLKSGNAKTGKMPVSTMSRKTCSDGCPLKGNKGCYGEGGPLSWHWNKVTAGIRGYTWEEYCAQVETLEDEQLWRHAQVGDLPGENDAIDGVKLRKLVRSNRRKRGFTYTHKPVINAEFNHVHAYNAAHIALANRHGFTINLSANDLNNADQLSDLHIGPVVTILPIDAPEKLSTPAGRTVIVCPAQSREDVTCLSCGLCQRSDRTVIVGFRAHGTRKKRTQDVFFKGAA